VIREPRLIEADPHFAGRTVDEVLSQLQEGFGCVVTLACGTGQLRPFLSTENKCTIYSKRPNDSVGMPAGDEQCQLARGSAGLPPLQSVEQQQQASYRQEYLRQPRQRACHGRGDTDLF